MNNRREDAYNINNYSDTDLYDLLDLVNPSDRVLEAKIIQMINRYTNIDNNSGKKLITFFKQIYDRFFDGGNDEDNLLDIVDPEKNGIPISNMVIERNSKQSTLENTTTQDDIRRSFSQAMPRAFTPPTTNSVGGRRPPEEFGEENEIIEGMTGGPEPQVPTVPLDPLSEPKGSSTNIKTNQLEYSKDYLNPLLKQTVKRIISIDSQYRDNKSSLSTNFTFNLSEPLKDVVSLSLYSIQIPYTWYTINNNFGGNFFYLKGNLPGIANGDFDYKINIPSGNYGPNDLVSSINIGFKSLKTEYPDISFGNTNINYNSNTGLATMNINLQNLYDETDYNLVFPTDPSLNRYPITIDPSYVTEVKQLRYNLNPVSTLSSYLGFNTLTYRPNAIYSNRNIIKTDKDTLSGNYVIDSTNNFFIIAQYQGQGYDPSNIVFSTKIILDISGSLTRTNIFNNINAQLLKNTYLDSSNTFITQTQITDPNAVNTGNYYYEFHVKWNKKTVSTSNIVGLKTAIVFPSELDSLTSYRIWTDISNNDNNTSCFGFQTVICETNNITAESTSLQTNYIINSKPYIALICTASGYTSGYTSGYPYIGSRKIHDDPSWNDYIIDISNSTATGGYSLDEYLLAINNAITLTNNKTNSINNSNKNGVFNLNNSKIIDDATTNNKISLKLDMNKHFKTDAYYIDLSNTVLWDILGIGRDISGVDGIMGMKIDLSSNNVFTATVANNLNSYGYDTGNLLLSVYPKSYSSTQQTNATADRWNIKTGYFQTNNTTVFYNNINLILHNFQDLAESNPLLSTNLTIKVNIDQTITSTLTVNVDKVLTQKNYKAVLYDPSSISTTDLSSNSWFTNLNIPNLTYDLSNVYVPGTSYSDISGSKTLSGYTYAINKDTYFTLQPLTNGITTTDNIITIKIPAAPAAKFFAYTRQELYNIINEAFSNNPLTNGSNVFTQIINGNQYVSIRLNINKLYTANDYRLVFYDPFSFVKCNLAFSNTQNATWDSTLGWILGYRIFTEYDLSKYYNSGTVTSVIVGDTTITTNLYNYFLIVLDDYTQSHLNDGLVTLTPHENQITLPSYTSRTAIQCDPCGNSLISGSALGNNGNNLTQNQIYAANQVLLAAKNQVKTYSNGPFIQDIFGLIPMKVSGLTVGAFYIEFGGTLQNQQRLYFGPVNIHRMTIKLITDRGDTVDLNGSNWSFSFVCEQLYQQKTI